LLADQRFATPPKNVSTARLIIYRICFVVRGGGAFGKSLLSDSAVTSAAKCDAAILGSERRSSPRSLAAAINPVSASMAVLVFIEGRLTQSSKVRWTAWSTASPPEVA